MSRILVLEDSPGLQRVIVSKLRLKGCEVIPFDNVPDALKFLDEGTSVDLFWVDHSLVGQETGLDFLKTIRSNRVYELYKDGDTILVTGEEADSYLEEYKSLGVSKYYAKSLYTVTQIVDEVEKGILD